VLDESGIVAAVVARLREIREERGISQYRLSKETGLSASGIRHMENGRVNPTLYFLLRICAFLGVDLADLLRVAAAKRKRK
jgi:transcriptional regulator with XRE-family HTH domain